MASLINNSTTKIVCNKDDIDVTVYYLDDDYSEYNKSNTTIDVIVAGSKTGTAKVRSQYYYAYKTYWNIYIDSVDVSGLFQDPGKDKSHTFTYDYTRGGTGTTSGSVKVYAERDIYVYDNYGWKNSTSTVVTVNNHSVTVPIVYTQNSSEKITLTKLIEENENERTWTYEATRETWGRLSEDTSIGDTLTDSITFTFYPHPAEFHFSYNLVNEQKKWLITESLSKLITNFSDFKKTAQQKLSWKNKTAITTPCPAFSKNGYLSASALTNIYDYLDSTTTFSKGDKVTLSIFDNLEKLVN